MTKTKKLISALLAALICAASAGAILLFGTHSLRAHAADDSTVHDAIFGTAHGESGVTALATETEIADGGKYYLDGSLNRDIVVPEGATVELCLNGKTLTGTGEGSVIKINGGTLTLHDCSSEHTGKITGGNAENGGGIYVDVGTLIMNGGTIYGNKATSNGGGVYVNGERNSIASFTMKGGAIEGNTATVDGGGVYANQTFLMEGGTISGNTADGKDNGDGVYTKSGASSMSGGEITGHDGVGIYIGGGSFAMTGGKITGNGTGIYVGMTFNLSGSPQVVDNKDGGTKQNVVIKNSKIITVNGQLEDEARLGITFENTQTPFTTGYAQNNKDHPAKYFFSDNDSYTVSLDNNEAVLGTSVEKSGIEATFEQGNNVIYTSAALNSLKEHLTVKVVNNDGSYANGGTPLNDNDYTLSGELTEGESVITVAYEVSADLIFTTTFTVNVTIDKVTQAEQVLKDYADGKLGESDLTSEEKEAIQPDIDGIIDAAKGEIGSGKDFNEVIEDAKKEIDDVIQSAEEKKALEDKKNRVETELKDYADGKLGESDLTSEEKEAIQPDIDDIIDSALGKIEQGEEVDKVVEDAKKEIDDVIQSAEEKKALEEKKKEAEKEIEDYFDEKTKDLTDEEKQELEQKKDDIIDSALGKIEQGEEVDKVVEDAKKEIDDLLAGDPDDGSGGNTGNNPSDNPGGNTGNNPSDNPGGNTGGNSSDNSGNKPSDNPAGSNLLWLAITLSVVMLAEVGALIFQLVRRNTNAQSAKESEGGNE